MNTQRTAIRADVQRYPQGAVLFREGDPSSHVIRIHSGFVKELKHSISGRDTIIGIYGKGDLLGGTNFIDREPYNTTAEAITPVIAERQPFGWVSAKVTEDPEYVRSITKEISQRLRKTEDWLARMATDRADQKLAALLLQFSEQHNGNGGQRLSVPLKRHELAEMTGTTVETAIRVLSRFAGAGAIKRNGSTILISNANHLRHLAHINA